MAPVTPDVFVFDSPAVGILSQLEADGFTVQLEPDNGMVIAPRSRLTPERMAEITRYKDALTLLLRCCDDGVQARRTVFEFQLAQTPAPACPGFVLKPDTPYVPGVCFSCGDTLPRPRFGRCWRCSLAWRLAARVSVPADLAVALDAAKVIT